MGKLTCRSGAQCRVCLNCHNPKTFSQIKFCVGRIVHSNVIDEIVDHQMGAFLQWVSSPIPLAANMQTSNKEIMAPFGGPSSDVLTA
jgi:hypothetical protein